MMDNGKIQFHKQPNLICVILKCVKKLDYTKRFCLFLMVFFVCVLLEVLASRADGVAHFGLPSLLHILHALPQSGTGNY